MHHTITQHQSTSCSDSRRLFELHRDDTSHSNLLSLEIGALEVECPAEIPTPTRLNTTLFPKVSRGGTSGVSKDPMKRRTKIHHVPPIYIHCERFVRCFNQFYQEAFQLDNPSLMEINQLIYAVSSLLAPLTQIFLSILPHSHRSPSKRFASISRCYRKFLVLLD